MKAPSEEIYNKSTHHFFVCWLLALEKVASRQVLVSDNYFVIMSYTLHNGLIYQVFTLTYAQRSSRLSCRVAQRYAVTQQIPCYARDFSRQKKQNIGLCGPDGRRGLRTSATIEDPNESGTE